MRRRLALLALVCTTGCPPAGDLCQNVKCGPGKICNPDDSTCIDNLDAGTDGGVDAGSVFDAGYFDAGTPCVPDCTDGEQCDLSSGHCVQCFTYQDCMCPTPICVNHTCVGLAADAGADLLPDGGTRSPIPGEDCATAAPLVLSGCDLPRSVSFIVDLTGRSDDEQGSCSAAGAGGRDLVYALTTQDTYDVEIDVTPLASNSVSPVVYMRENFCVGGNELDCEQSTGDEVQLKFKSLAPATYWLVLDTFDSVSAGPVTLTITYTAPTLPGNETCALAADIELSGVATDDGGTTDAGVTIVDLSKASDDEPTSCNVGSTYSPDVVYSFVVTQVEDVIVTAAAVDPNAGLLPVVEIRTPDCLLNDRIICRSSQGASSVSFRERSLPIGTYYLVLEAFSEASAGPIALTLTAQAPSEPQTNETCDTARDVTFPPDGGTSVEFDVDTSQAHDDETSTCSDLMADGGSTPPFDGGNPEYVYHLRFNSQRNVTVTAVPDDAFVDPVLYFREAPCEGGLEWCVDDFFQGGTETLNIGTVPAGDYYLFVESWVQSSGLMHVTVSASP